MSIPRRPGPVLVGVNDEPSSDLALRWAISDARTLGVAVKVVNAFSGTPGCSEPMYRDIPDADLQEPDHVAEQLIARIIDQAREIDPEVVVEGETIEGRPSRVLVQEASFCDRVGPRLASPDRAALGRTRLGGRGCGRAHRVSDDRRAGTSRTAGGRRVGRGGCGRHGQPRRPSWPSASTTPADIRSRCGQCCAGIRICWHR